MAHHPAWVGHHTAGSRSKPTVHPCPLRWGGCGLLTGTSTHINESNETQHDNNTRPQIENANATAIAIQIANTIAFQIALAILIAIAVATNEKWQPTTKHISFLVLHLVCIFYWKPRTTNIKAEDKKLEDKNWKPCWDFWKAHFFKKKKNF